MSFSAKSKKRKNTSTFFIGDTRKCYRVSIRHFLDFLDPEKMSVNEVTFSLTKSVFHQRVLVTVAERFLKKPLGHGDGGPTPVDEKLTWLMKK